MTVFPALFGLFVAALVSGQDQVVEIRPKEAVRRVGDELIILCKVPYKLDSCRIILGKDTYRLTETISTDELAYSGQGLEMGECGALLKSIKEEWNGNVSCLVPPQDGIKEISAVMRLVVARAPGDPQLRGPTQPQFQEDESITAQCVVPDGRPAAKITWFLDEEPLLVGVHHPVITSETGSDLQTISQNITRTLTANDGGKKLVCRAEHEAFDGPKEASRQLIVYYPPKREDSGPITIFGLKLGAEGRLNVTIRSNPEPHPEWTVGDQRLVPGQSNDAATAQALPPLHLGNGYYNITLVLHRVTKEDVDHTYYLRVSNDLGHEEFPVRISTMDEPAGVELETGAIVGIVVGVLVLLIVISLIVFAKATDRWCFGGSGRGRDHTRSSGESSDTESAVGGRERSRLAGLTARMRAVLPRAKDKVQATEAPATDTEERPLSEDKKGVVYAELVLSEQPTAEKPTPPATEYAEIVYTDQPAQPKETKE